MQKDHLFVAPPDRLLPPPWDAAPAAQPWRGLDIELEARLGSPLPQLEPGADPRRALSQDVSKARQFRSLWPVGLPDQAGRRRLVQAIVECVDREVAAAAAALTPHGINTLFDRVCSRFTVAPSSSTPASAPARPARREKGATHRVRRAFMAECQLQPGDEVDARRWKNTAKLVAARLLEALP